MVRRSHWIGAIERLWAEKSVWLAGVRRAGKTCLCRFRPYSTYRASEIVAACKWRAPAFDPRNARAFRARYPGGDNLVVTPDTEGPYVRSYRGTEVRFVGLTEFMRRALVAGPGGGEGRRSVWWMSR